MNQKNKHEVVNYTLGIAGFATLVALLKSVTQSKALTAMVLVGHTFCNHLFLFSLKFK